ncbi:MAG: TraB/GumN family protein [Spirochaetales bacterium]
MSDTVTRLEHNGRTYVLVGTAHVSQASIDEVKAVIEAEKPDQVAVEIDAGRYQSLSNPTNWAQLDIFKVLREGKGFLLLANLALSSFQRKIGEELEVKPGQEMLAAVQTAETLGIPFAFIDRQVQVTLQRAWKKSSLWGKSKLMALLMGSVLGEEKVDSSQIENLKNRNELDSVMGELAKELPTVKQVLIDERDQYLATSLFELATAGPAGTKIVAVVGAGHVPGMTLWLNDLAAGSKAPDLVEISSVPKPTLGEKVWPWILPLAFVGLLGAGFFLKGSGVLLSGLLAVVISTALFGAIGSIAALAHPVTILVSIVAAPLAALFHGLVHIAYFTGPTEAWLRKPRVADLEALAQDATTFTGYYKNRVLRILLVVVLSTLGATVGWYLSLVPLLGALLPA